MAAVKETVLYYNPEKSDKIRLIKGILVRMGMRIRNITPDLVNQKVGYLAGLKDFTEEPEEPGEALPVIPEEMMVLHGFSDRRLDELLKQLRKNKVPVALKAVLTQSNCEWSFYQLYEEIRAEHEQMTAAENSDSV